MSDELTSQRDAIEELADSFVARYRGGQRPSVEEYAQRYPELADQLRELLPALVMLEQHGSPDELDGQCRSEADFDRPALRELGDFTIVREIGRGGMGVVYEAVQQSLGRHVALKVLLSPGLLNPSHLERFRLEARAAAGLHHSHIVPVFGVGEHEGVHYYAMQFIHGQSLDLVIEVLRQLRSQHADSTAPAANRLTRAVTDGLMTGHFRAGEPGDRAADPADKAAGSNGSNGTPERPLDGAAGGTAAPRPSPPSPLSKSEFSSSHSGWEFYRSVARVGLQVADALAYAHGEGILHRDIKPSNLLVDAKGNVWITDFGLAKAEGTEGLTQTGDFVGTLRYMAPERLEGWADRRSDIYSLGVTLYELTTLQVYMDSSSRGRLVERILHESAAPPSRFDRSIPRDLETIILKAIAREPASRYHTAELMAEDLRRFLADRPILARRSTPRERFVRWCRRNPLVATLTGAVAALAVAAVVILSVSNARIRHESTARAIALNEKDSALTTAHDAINQMLTRTANEAFADAPRLHPVRVELLDDALKFYEALASKPGADPMIRYEMAEVLHIKSGLERELDRYDDAERSLRRAIVLAESIVAMDPNPPQFREEIAVRERDLGLTWQFTNNPPADNDRRVEAQYRKVLGLFDDLERQWPERPQPVVLCMRYLADFAKRRGDFAEAERLWRSAIERGEAYVAKYPQEDNEMHEIAWACAGLFDLLMQGSDERVSEAEAVLQRGLQPVAAQLQQQPKYMQALDVATALRLRLALCYCRQDRVADALPWFEQASSDMESLCEAFPWNASLWANLTWFHGDMAAALRNAGRPDEAGTILRRYRDWLQAIRAKLPAEPGPQEKLRHNQTELIRLFRETGLEREGDELAEAAK